MSGPDFYPKSYAKPAEDVSDIPAIDNTVKVGRMRPDGTIEFTSVMSAFPTEEERKAKDRGTGHIAERRPTVRVQRVDWDEIWPSIEQRMRDNPSIDAQTLAGYYGVPYLELHIRMAEWKKANVKGDDVLTEKKRLTKYTKEERLDLARQIKDKVAMGYTKLGAAKEMGIAPGNADRWLKELAKVEADEYDKEIMDEAMVGAIDPMEQEAEREYFDEFAWDESDAKRTEPIPPAIIGLDDMKLEWIQDTFGLRMPSNERLAIIQQIAAIGG